MEASRSSGIQTVFQAGAVDGDGLDGLGFEKLLRQARLLDRDFTTEDARMVFARAVSCNQRRCLDLQDFKAALREVAACKGLHVSEVHQALSGATSTACRRQQQEKVPPEVGHTFSRSLSTSSQRMPMKLSVRGTEAAQKRSLRTSLGSARGTATASCPLPSRAEVSPRMSMRSLRSQHRSPCRTPSDSPRMSARGSIDSSSPRFSARSPERSPKASPRGQTTMVEATFRLFAQGGQSMSLSAFQEFCEHCCEVDQRFQSLSSMDAKIVFARALDEGASTFMGIDEFRAAMRILIESADEEIVVEDGTASSSTSASWSSMSVNSEDSISTTASKYVLRGPSEEDVLGLKSRPVCLEDEYASESTDEASICDESASSVGGLSSSSGLSWADPCFTARSSDVEIPAWMSWQAATPSWLKHPTCIAAAH